LTSISPIKEIEVVQLEEEMMKIAKYASILCAAVIIAIICGGNWIAAKGPPVAGFPSFIPFTITKTGDVAVDKVGNVYVNFTTNDGKDQIWKISPDGEEAFLVAELGEGTAYGLAVNAKGDLYAAMRTSPTGNSRVYKVGRDGVPVQLPGTDKIVWANSLAFDQRGNLYVTETYSGSGPAYNGQGGIWRIPPGGEAEVWLRDDLLTGLGGAPPTGANGISFYHGDLYVVNTFRYPSSKVVRVPIHPDGSPGYPDVWAELKEVPESPLAGGSLPPAGDGLALDVHGNVYVAVVTRAAVVRIDAEGMYQETIATFGDDENEPLFARLDGPNSLAFGTGKGGRQSLFVTNTGASYRGLVSIEVGVPGLPLP
jgi:sugar lactone lactonase YvrE